jgi:pimeloyl-ACP methyl ester carboxylesterase
MPEYPSLLSRATILLLVLAILLLPLAPRGYSAPADPPLPLPLDPPGGEAWMDNIYFGAIPPISEGKQVLVFVHGLGRFAEDWWSSGNDMYLLAYDAGYRTAFVTLDFPRNEPANSIWENGETLSRQLEFIASYYQVEKVEIVAHSKGGIDSQVAIVYHDAWRHVDHVFTLGSPHHGSELADAAMTNPALRLLLEGLGAVGDGLLDIQTEPMRAFRKQTDTRQENELVRYYSGAGNRWDDARGLSITGNFLQERFGDNDGFVTVESTFLPYATPLFLEPYNHFNIFTGTNAFRWIDDILAADVPPEQRETYLPLVVNGAGEDR